MDVYSYVKNRVLVQLAPSRVSSVGVYALEDIPVGKFLFTKWEGPTGRFILTEKQLRTFSLKKRKHIHDIFRYNPDFPKNTDSWIYLRQGCHWIFQTPYYWVNAHLNYQLDKDTGITIKPIKAGTEIYSNYFRYERESKKLF